ncbi:MAG: hypothetical protein R2698_14000 [Microthrixaceae bacterium]
MSSPAVVYELARHLNKGGVLDRAARSIRRAGRFAGIPTHDQSGTPVDPRRDEPDPAIVRDALARFWDRAEVLAMRLIGEVSGDGPTVTPDWWDSEVVSLARQVGDELLDRVDRLDPSRVFHTAEARSLLRRALRPPTSTTSEVSR